MSTPEQYVNDALLMTRIGRDRWALQQNCPQGCACSVCWELNAAHERLTTGLKEIQAVAE